ncbi:MAG TPA: hypothetical protein ENN05_00495 [Deltaproteobacteria bacterium]|nr:hypothetical protein [Deltaproteobacteria bacterium]
MSSKGFIMGFVALMLPVVTSAGQRDMFEKPDTVCLRIGFNSEKINAYYLLLDARTSREKERDRNRKGLSGPVIVFFQGHAQRPSDAYAFTSRLAAGSKSGIVVIPVCDTPYGSDEAWRGDRGKDVVLMEVLKWALSSEGIEINGYGPVYEGDVLVNNVRVDSLHGGILSDIVCVGWSHGGILARRFAHAYQSSVIGLAQICPAGYEHWSPMHLTFRFMRESWKISGLGFKGHARDCLCSAWGFTRGFAGDFLRSVPSAVINLHAAKLCRVGRDIRDCSSYCDSPALRISMLGHLVVIFADQDTCMDARNILGCEDPQELTEEQILRFWDTYFSGIRALPVKRTLAVLPGTHLAPLTHSEIYADAVLENLGQSFYE